VAGHRGAGFFDIGGGLFVLCDHKTAINKAILASFGFCILCEHVALLDIAGIVWPVVCGVYIYMYVGVWPNPTRTETLKH
jgi:hypothetical protein